MSKPLKSPTTYQQQVSILESRNIIVTDRAFCESFLSHVNYYRFTGYLLPFRCKTSESCYESVKFEQLIEIYHFDTELRSLLSAAIEKIEIFLRTQLAYYSAHHYGADGYVDANNYNSKHDHVKFLGLVYSTVKENEKAPAIHHHISEYGGKFPIWVIIDYFTMGMLSHFYTDMKNPDKSALALSIFSVNYQTLTSWLRCLTDLRNRCAHYSRLYFWKFSAIPKIPQGDSFIADRTLFSQIYMLKQLYPDKDSWNTDVLNPLVVLLAKYKNHIFKEHIGFPSDWESVLMYQ